MNMVIRIIGIVLVLFALLGLIKPDFLRGIMMFFKKGNRIYIPALIRFALAVVFFLGARESGHFWVIFVFGILFLLSGLLIIILGPKKIGSILDWYLKQPVLFLRFLTLVAAAFGIVIIIFA